MSGFNKTGRTYGLLVERIRAVAQSKRCFTRLDAGIDCHRATLLYNLVRRGEIEIVRRGRPGRFSFRMTVYRKANA